eukprot:COSAG02_NODE_45206_length_359_cov_0.800000_1_plen_57_part_01
MGSLLPHLLGALPSAGDFARAPALAHEATHGDLLLVNARYGQRYGPRTTVYQKHLVI